MTAITLAGSLAAVDRPARSITYRLLPYGEQGRTSRGLVTARRGSVTAPEDLAAVHLNLEHDRTQPLGVLAAVIDDAEALWARFTIAATRAGDDLLTEVEAGLRPGASVELDDVVISNGALLAGRLVAAGACTRPAFPTAVATLVAADTEGSPTVTVPTGPPVAPAPVAPMPAPVPTPPAAPAAPAPVATTAPVAALVPAPSFTATAVAPPGLAAPPSSAPLTAATVNRLLASVSWGDRSPELLAALSDITRTGGIETEQGQWLGEVWSGNAFRRRFVPLLASAPLTGYKLTGWRWTVKPEGAAYAGDKGAVASNAATTEAVTANAARFAGAHDVDRKFIDFPDEGFWASYWNAMAASYARWSDALASAAIIAGAGAAIPAIGDGVLGALITGALDVIETGPVDFALVDSASYVTLALTSPSLAFVAGAVDLTNPVDGTTIGRLNIQPASGLAAGQVLVGSRAAITFHELPGSPIRVDAVNIANGGVDVGVFGYAGTILNDAAGLSLVTVTP